MRRAKRVLASVLALVMVLSFLTACGGSSDALSGTWKQTDEVNGNWTWTFDGGNCTLEGETTGFKGEGTYTLDENAKTVKIKIDSWDNEVEYTYNLSGSNLDLDSTYSSYKLVKQ